MSNSDDTKCENRIDDSLASRLEDLKALWEHPDDNDVKNDIGELNDYGLSFDYVAPHTFNDQKDGYFRYQISWGGPSEEFRFTAEKSGYRWVISDIEFWFLDWFDGAHRTLYGDDYDLMKQILGDFLECSGEHVYNEAMEDYNPEEYEGFCRKCDEYYEFDDSDAEESNVFCSKVCEDEHWQEEREEESEDEQE